MSDSRNGLSVPFTGPAEPPAYLEPVAGERHPIDAPRWRSDGGRPLIVAPGPGIASDDIEQGERSLWRYRRAIPVDVGQPITLGEGLTPLVPAVIGGSRALCKLEWFSPSGSFKDRGASVMLSVLRQQGIGAVVEDSSGNGGAAVACYAAAGNLDATVFAPASTSREKLAQAAAYGARIEPVEGPREASQAAAITAASSGRGFYASHNWQAFFVEGTKTLAYELWEDLGFRAPDSVVVPVGAGSLLLGLALGFAELRRAGQIERSPRLFAAQPLNCSPVDAAFTGASREMHPTIAEGTAIREPLRLPEMLAALRASGGGTVTASEGEILAARTELARSGLFVEPTSAVAAAGYERLIAAGAVTRDDTVVVVLTGSGLKTAG